MRYPLLIAILLLIFSNAHSQNPPETKIDSMLVNIDKARFTSGVLYDRVMPWTNLNTFNDSVNISNTKHFEQALLELYNASNKTKFISPPRLKTNYSADSLVNIVDLGIINASFHQLNYNLEKENEGGLRVLADKFEKIDNGKPAFLEKHVLLIAPLRTYAVGPRITFRFDNGLLL